MDLSEPANASIPIFPPVSIQIIAELNAKATSLGL